MPNDATSAIPSLTIMEAAAYLLYGFGVVLTTLVLLWFATALMSKIVKGMGLDKMPEPSVTKARSHPIADETIAVITAAVSFATGGTLTIKSIQKKS